MSFGDILKKLRQDNNLTQEELAKKINNSRSNIANYENGKNMPSVEVLERLSEIFNVSTDYLLGKSDIRNPEEIKMDNDKIIIGLSKKDYNPPTKEQQDKIEEYAKFVLKDNLKKKEDEKNEI